MDNFNIYKIIKTTPQPQKLSKCFVFLHIRGAISGICKGPKPLHRYNPPKKKKKEKKKKEKTKHPSFHAPPPTKTERRSHN
jgi:hypothetical protein